MAGVYADGLATGVLFVAVVYFIGSAAGFVVDRLIEVYAIRKGRG